MDNCHCVLEGGGSWVQKSQFVNWLPRFIFGFLCTSSQIHQQKFKLSHKRLYLCSCLPSYIALLTTNCHLVGHVKKSVGGNKIECDEWSGSVSNISCPGIKNLDAVGSNRLILKDFIQNGAEVAGHSIFDKGKATNTIFSSYYRLPTL